MLKKLVKSITDYFTFNKREKNGFLVLSFILIIIITARIIVINSQPFPNIELHEIQIVDSVLSRWESKETYKSDKRYSNAHSNPNRKGTDSGHLLLFDPNLINEQDASKLGFTQKQIKTILNYRAKGGVFKEAADLKKIYGISPGLYYKLEKKIRIDPAFQRNSFEKSNSSSASNAIKIIELNSADSMELLKLKGIGPTFAKRILAKRRLLNGFYSLSQLKEIYGMNDSLIQLISSQLSIDSNLIQKININDENIIKIENHPYMGKKMATIFFNFRKKHGYFADWTDVIKTGIIDKEKINQLKPYIKFE